MKNYLTKNVNSIDVGKYFISAALSSFDKGKWFHSSKGDLRDALTSLFFPLDDSLVRDHLFSGYITPFEKGREETKFYDKNVIRVNLSSGFSYGAHLGLSNWGAYYDFLIDRGDSYVKKRERCIEDARGFLGEDRFDFFRGFGERLRTIYC